MSSAHENVSQKLPESSRLSSKWFTVHCRSSVSDGETQILFLELLIELEDDRGKVIALATSSRRHTAYLANVKHFPPAHASLQTSFQFVS
jgi:hypothetical protein